jgi:hypothetical protein
MASIVRNDFIKIAYNVRLYVGRTALVVLLGTVVE